MRLVRIYPRMTMGGVERHVLELLDGFPGTEMVVPGIEGWAAQEAKKKAGKYTFIPRPRFAETVRAIQGADIAHIHAINNDPVLAAAVQIAEPKRAIVTVHNEFDALYTEFADQSLVFNEGLLALCASPSRTQALPYGIPLPERLSCEGRGTDCAIRLLEIRRPDKPMSCVLSDVLEHSSLKGLELEVRVVGVESTSADPRVSYLGELSDPTAHMEWADFIVHFSETETFGRVVYEAMASGALPVVTPLPVFKEKLGLAPFAWFASDHSLDACAKALREAIVFADRSMPLADERSQNFAWLQSEVSANRMVDRISDVYREVILDPAAPKSFFASDVPGNQLDHLGKLLDEVAVGDADVSIGDDDELSDTAKGVLRWVQGMDDTQPAQTRFAALIESLRLMGPRLGILRSLGSTAMELGEFELATSALGQAIQADPFVTWPYLSLFEAQVKTSQLREALETAEALVRNIPQYAEGKALVEQLRNHLGQ